MNTTERGMLVPATGVLVIAAGVAFAGVRFFGEEALGQNLEAAVGALAFGAVIAAPGVLALLSLDHRPALIYPAAVLLVPLSFLSFALVTLPLLIPAIVLSRRFARVISAGAVWQVTVTSLLVLALLFAALLALLAHDDPRQYTAAARSYSTSDVITYWEAALSLALTASAVWVGWRFIPTVRSAADDLRRVGVPSPARRSC